MAATWAIAALLTGYIYACEASICSSVRRSLSYQYTTYMHCSGGCCGTKYHRTCCAPSGSIVGIVIGVILSVIVVAFLISLCCKKKNRNSRVIMPQTGVAHANVTLISTRMIGPNGSLYPVSHMPVPPPYKAYDPPPPYPATPIGRGNNRPIRTGHLPPGRYQDPANAWQVPPPGPPPNYNPPMPQPDYPAWQAPPPTPPPIATAPAFNSGVTNTIHPPPGPITPATAPPRNS